MVTEESVKDAVQVVLHGILSHGFGVAVAIKGSNIKVTVTTPEINGARRRLASTFTMQGTELWRWRIRGATVTGTGRIR